MKTEPDDEMSAGDAEKALWMLTNDTPESRAAFMVNWLRGTIKIPDDVRLRIWAAEDEKRQPETHAAIHHRAVRLAALRKIEDTLDREFYIHAEIFDIIKRVREETRL